MRITVVKEETKELVKYYVIRAIKDTGLQKKCIAEKKCNQEPTEEEIGMFLYETKADFCSVAVNYKLDDELPFA